MSRNDLTGDFITDHPFAALGIAGLFLGLLSGVNDISLKDKYDIQERENRKIAIRNQLMREIPYREPDFIDEFAQYVLDNIYEKPEIVNVDSIVKEWNRREKLVNFRPKRIINENLSQKDKEEALEQFWLRSNRYEQAKKNAWQAYLQMIEETMILRRLI